MLQPQIFEVGEEVAFSTLATEFARENGPEELRGTIDHVKRMPKNSISAGLTDWAYDIRVDDYHGKPWVFQEVAQCLIGKLVGHEAEPCLYGRGKTVRFECGGSELTGEIVVVDNRAREYSTYCSDWSYDIMVEDYQGSPCIFKHVPQYKILGVQR